MNLLLDRSAHPVIGHRGAAGLAPENTMAAFRAGVAAGAEAIELDVRLTSDGHAVVIHDPTLDRTTDRRGEVGKMRLEEIRAADAGYRFEAGGSHPWRGRDVRVPLLSEVVAGLPEAPLLIELKHAEAGAEVARVLREAGAAERAVVAGEDHLGLVPFDRPPFHRGASRRDIVRLLLGIVEPAAGCRCYAVPLRHRGLFVPSRRFVRAAARRQSTVHVWTVDEKAGAVEAWESGANGIVTNRPDLMRRWRDEQFPAA